MRVNSSLSPASPLKEVVYIVLPVGSKIPGTVSRCRVQTSLVVLFFRYVVDMLSFLTSFASLPGSLFFDIPSEPGIELEDGKINLSISQLFSALLSFSQLFPAVLSFFGMNWLFIRYWIYPQATYWEFAVYSRGNVWERVLKDGEKASSHTEIQGHILWVSAVNADEGAERAPLRQITASPSPTTHNRRLILSSIRWTKMSTRLPNLPSWYELGFTRGTCFSGS